MIHVKVETDLLCGYALSDEWMELAQVNEHSLPDCPDCLTALLSWAETYEAVGKAFPWHSALFDVKDSK